MDIKRKTLSSKSAEVLKHFIDTNEPCFTLQQVAELIQDTSRDAVKKLMRDMVKRGLLMRVKEGVYWIVPYEQDADTYFPNSHLLAKYLVNDADFYIGYYSALEIHSLITQPSFQERIVVNKQIKPSTIKIKGHKFQFIYHNQHHFFGGKKVWIDSFNKVCCSDLEKTFVDCLYKPDYAGGITEIAKALFKAKSKIDFEKLLQYCKDFGAQSVVKRLGFLLDTLNIDSSISEELSQMKTTSVILLEPTYERRGKIVPQWSLQQNIETTDITSPVFS